MALLCHCSRTHSAPTAALAFGPRYAQKNNTFVLRDRDRGRWRRRGVCAASSGDGGTRRPPPLRLTYLEGNSWLWEVSGTRVAVDPILVGNLDFGIPWLYDAAKKTLKNFRLEDLQELDCLLITQSLDDHCHMKTLKPLSKIYPDLCVVSTPNAEPILKDLFDEVIYIEPGQSTRLRGKNGSEIDIRASAGPILGPPWQRPENGTISKVSLADITGQRHIFEVFAVQSTREASRLTFLKLGYFIEAHDPKFILYYEPHCVYNKSLLEGQHADVIITPVIKQLLPAFTLVSGQEDAVELARLLNARFIVPMNNGDLESKGILSSILYTDGTMESFKALLSKALLDVQVLEPTPGLPLEVPIRSGQGSLASI
uniref:Metallo-beta-lactamase domain-containing protein n=1 Tax=Picea sitchensis TaxID=3332 RepID=A9NQQ5_PICSI|nr:unknown [Picea sitchensis]